MPKRLLYQPRRVNPAARRVLQQRPFVLKRTVLKLAFAQPLRYNRNEGYRTAEITYPFKMLADFLQQKCGLVEPRGIEPLASSLRTMRSTN